MALSRLPSMDLFITYFETQGGQTSRAEMLRGLSGHPSLSHYNLESQNSVNRSRCCVPHKPRELRRLQTLCFPAHLASFCPFIRIFSPLHSLTDSMETTLGNIR